MRALNNHVASLSDTSNNAHAPLSYSLINILFSLDFSTEIPIISNKKDT